MPHADLKYSADIALDAADVLARIETVLQAHDPGSGDCKGRAIAIEQFHHTHLIADISLLPKPHRDAAFMAAVRVDVLALLREVLPRPCWLSLDVRFSADTYVTEVLT